MHQDDLIFTPPAKRHLDPWAYVFLAPAGVLLAVFLLYPALWTVLVSFQKYDAIGGSGPFAGVAAFLDQLESPRLWRAILNTIYFAAIYVPGSLVIGYVLASLINRVGRGRNALRAVFFIPVLLPAVAGGILWRWMYDPQFGILNHVLGALGIAPIGWLGEGRLALPCVAAACVWQGAGLVAAILSAAIWAMPKAFDDVAEMDGVCGWRWLVHVRLPLLKNALLVSVLLLLINAQRTFTTILVMTGDGGPANWSTNLPFLIYRKGMKNFDFSGASAVATILCFSIAIMVVLMYRYPVRGRERR